MLLHSRVEALKLARGFMASVTARTEQKCEPQGYGRDGSTCDAREDARTREQDDVPGRVASQICFQIRGVGEAEMTVEDFAGGTMGVHLCLEEK